MKRQRIKWIKAKLEEKQGISKKREADYRELEMA